MIGHRSKIARPVADSGRNRIVNVIHQHIHIAHSEKLDQDVPLPKAW